MLLSGILSTLATCTVFAIVTNFSSMGMLAAFLCSWIAVFLGAGALMVKENALKKGISSVGRFVATSFTLLPLVIGFNSFLDLWKSETGFWFTAVMLWLGLLSVMFAWVPAMGGEEN